MKNRGEIFAKCLVGLCLAVSGCQITLNEEARKIIKYTRGVENILEIKKGEDYKITLPEKNKDFLKIKIYKQNSTIIRWYYDSNKDGLYDTRDSLTIPKKLDIKILPKLPEFPKEDLRKYDFPNQDLGVEL